METETLFQTEHETNSHELKQHPALIEDQQRRAETHEAEAEIWETLTELSPQNTPFRAEGVARVWYTRRDDNGEYQKFAKLIPIRSVNIETVRSALKIIWPQRMKARKKKVYDEQRRAYVETLDETSFEYQRTAMDFIDMKVLYGLNVPIYNMQGELAWDPQDPEHQDVKQGLQALKGYDFDENQYRQLQESIDALTKEQDDDLEKNFGEL